MELVQWINFLLHKLEDWSLIPRHSHKMLGGEFDSLIVTVLKGQSQGVYGTNWLTRLVNCWDPASVNKVERLKGGDTTLSFGFHMCVYSLHECTCMHTNEYSRTHHSYIHKQNKTSIACVFYQRVFIDDAYLIILITNCPRILSH